jgi:hypothetical protein
MTSAGVEGTAGFCYLGASLTPAGRAALFINRDDERRGPRYIGPRYPQAPAGATPRCIRRERRVASALHTRIDSMSVSLICGADGTTGRARLDVRLRVRPAAIGTA